MTSAQGFVRAKRYHFSRDPLTTWDGFEGLSVNSYLQVVRILTTSKGGFATSQTAEILEQPEKIRFQNCDVDTSVKP